jgi:diamine N-acetyltransferase
MVNLKPVTQENFLETISLKVGEEQRFVASNVFSIAESKVDSSLIPLVIYNDQTIVVFLLYGIDHEDGNYEIVRLMVDEKYQKNGYGKKAMEIIMEKIKEDKSHNKILISTDPRNIVGLNLYKKLGFKSTGKIIDGEEVLEIFY